MHGLAWILVSSTCCCLAWAGHNLLGFQERNRPRFSNSLRLFWICSFILSTVSFSIWIRHRSETDFHDSKPFATVNRITTISRFAQSIGLILLGIIQEIQVRSSQQGTIQDRAISTQSSRTTLVQDCLPGARTTPNKKDKKKKAGTGPGGQSAAAQKDYKRPTTFKEFYEHCKRLRPYIWPSKSRKLQIHILLCLLLLVVGRFVNVLVPLQVGNVVNALRQVSDGTDEGKDENGNPRFIWKEIMIFICLRALQGSVGAVDTLQGLLWIPVGQFNTRELAVKMFEHLLNLSLRFHLNRKTGEMLRVQGKQTSFVLNLNRAS